MALLLCLAMALPVMRTEAETVEVFHDSFDSYGVGWTFPAGGWHSIEANKLNVADRGGGDLYLNSESYQRWGIPAHDVAIDWTNALQVVFRADMRSLGCRSWVGLDRGERWYMGEYGMNGNWGIRWDSVNYPSAVACDASWHILRLVVDKAADTASLYIDEGRNPIVTVRGIGTGFETEQRVAMRIQRHGTYSQVADVSVEEVQPDSVFGVVIIVQ